MTEVLELTRDDLFGDGRSYERVSTVLIQELSRRSLIVLTTHAGGATLSFEGGRNVNATLLQGAWRAPGIVADGHADCGARVCLPLLFDAAVIKLHPNDLITFGNPHRPVADIFVRSLFFAGVRGSPIVWRTGPIGAPDVTRELLRRYYYVFKAYLPDQYLNVRTTADALDLIVADQFMEVLTFENPLLRAGSKSLRESRGVGRLRSSIEQVRATVLDLLAS